MSRYYKIGTYQTAKRCIKLSGLFVIERRRKNEINPIFDSSRFLLVFVQSFDKNKIEMSKRM
ncbi:hypothetical protein DLM78_19415 [Leptospira stimsonii]|uniref:Uncharacterized protein n=1 Tax=Leptospira stimsonii TaxID=2202203 RepID=A0A8B3CJ92_9LEPT|nr:hypothetical protein DLM78_19415 [Leptospira stimsonii]